MFVTRRSAYEVLLLVFNIKHMQNMEACACKNYIEVNANKIVRIKIQGADSKRT